MAIEYILAGDPLGLGNVLGALCGLVQALLIVHIRVGNDIPYGYAPVCLFDSMWPPALIYVELL